MESAAAIAALGVAMWQFLQIDPGLIGFVMVCMALPIIATITVARGRLSRGTAAAATGYLLLVSVGSWIGPYHAIFPGVGGEHPGGTDFAAKWNSLDLTSRRLIAWNMGLTALAVWMGLPYVLFWRDLQRARRGLPAQLSSATCWFGLTVFWGSLLLALPVFIAMLF
jgi:hypothetical protein